MDRSTSLKRWIAIGASGVIVAFGQPAWSPALSFLSSVLGYALFWVAILQMPRRFWIGAAWFFAVQLVQNSWLASSEYMGPGIFAVYAFVCVGIGAQFGWMCSLIKKPIGLLQAAGLAGFWVLLEWARLLPLTGFPWNPAGMALATESPSIQWASLFGIYGLSFWVIWVNLLALRAFLDPGKRAHWIQWLCCAAMPFLFGFAQTSFWKEKKKSGTFNSIALVQTALMNEEKYYTKSRSESFLPPLEQWGRILGHLRGTGKERFDLIVLPEGALPWPAKRPLYYLDDVKKIWDENFGADACESLPPLTPQNSHMTRSGEALVSNLYWAQAIADRFRSEVILGLTDADGRSSYNSAFHLKPGESDVRKYDKRVLVPIGEYLPFGGWKPLAQFVASQFGIADSFAAGSEAKVFAGLQPMGVAICSEEVYPDLVRESREKGAELIVTISNDAWFPRTRLPWHHHHHSRIRAAENGVYLLRSCNTGVTGAVDCFGRTLKHLPVSDTAAGALAIDLQVSSFPTLYTLWGNIPVLLASLLFASALFILRRGEEKVALNGSLD